MIGKIAKVCLARLGRTCGDKQTEWEVDETRTFKINLPVL